MICFTNEYSADSYLEIYIVNQNTDDLHANSAFYAEPWCTMLDGTEGAIWTIGVSNWGCGYTYADPVIQGSIYTGTTVEVVANANCTVTSSTPYALLANAGTNMCLQLLAAGIFAASQLL